MPINRVSYRGFDGQYDQHHRWAIVVKHELKVLIKSRFFIVLLIVALLHLIVRVLQIVAWDTVIQNPNNPITPMLRQIEGLAVSGRLFFDYIRMEGVLVFIACLYAGSGMICNDFSNNLMEIYFSKPISWKDFVLGKVMTLVLIGLMLTAIPGIFLVVLHNALDPGMDTFRDSCWWPRAIMGFSAVIVFPSALSVLACSALLRSQRYASIVLFMLLAASSAMGGLFDHLLHNKNYLLLSFPMALNRVGEQLFKARTPVFALSWTWAFAFVACVSVWSLWVICRRVRRAEIAM